MRPGRLRPEQIARAVAAGKHIISEKPVADTVEHEWQAVELVEKAPLFSTVNLYLRNSWYHQTIRQFIDRGEIGELAIIRVCHMTPGLAPGEGHEYEGPAFHDCGMHYVDIARWYARSSSRRGTPRPSACGATRIPGGSSATEPSKTAWSSTSRRARLRTAGQGPDPQLLYDIIGTKGIARMTHDFKTAVVELRGTTQTHCIERPFGGKNIGTMCERFARSIESGVRDEALPTFRDAAIASEYAWRFLQDARNDMPAIGTPEELEEIRDRRRKMTNGYGLLRKRA